MGFSLINKSALVLGTLMLFACNTQQNTVAKEELVVKPEQKKEVAMPDNEKADKVKISKVELSKVELDEMQWIEGKIIFLNLEGGFYGIVTKQGEKLLPMNLETKFRLHNAKVRVQGKLQKDIRTFQQWGTPFRISAIELIKAGSGAPEADQ